MTRPPVYIARHGQTDWNAEHRLQGQADTDINALGRAQADRNGRLLRDLISEPRDFDFVASPMRRTRETMERVRAAIGLDPHGYRTDARLMELHFGDWQGFTYREVEQRFPGSTEARELDKWNYCPPGDKAESYAMLAARVRPWFDELSRPTLCVTHGGIVRVLFQALASLPQAEAAAMDVPQDRVLRLEGNRLDWL